MAQMQAAVDVPVIASGGVTTADDVARLAAAAWPAASSAGHLYEGTLTLADALRVAGEAAKQTYLMINRLL